MYFLSTWISNDEKDCKFPKFLGLSYYKVKAP